MRKRASNLFLVLAILSFGFHLSCEADRPEPLDIEAPHSEPVSVTTVAGSYRLQLTRNEQKCVLSYRNLRSGHEGSEEMDIAAPCNFLRDFDGEVESRLYGNIENKVRVLIVAGGPIYPGSRGDAFQPEGCGTESQGIAVFDDRIELRRYGNHGAGQICPSKQLEEVYWATQYPKDK